VVDSSSAHTGKIGTLGVGIGVSGQRKTCEGAINVSDGDPLSAP
jgi:hypothetical protein